MLRLFKRGLTIIPEVVDYNLDATRPWFVMPWYKDGSLEGPIRRGEFRRHPLSGVSLLIKLARAIEALHQERVAHRDLKPANIFRAGDSVLLGDLGLNLDLAEHAERITSTDEAVGARLYTAPENESGRNEASDQRPADFYAFGKITWAVLAGRNPPARERQLASPWTLKEQLGDSRFEILHTLEAQLLELEPSRRLSDWKTVVLTLRSFASFLNAEGPLVRDNLGVARGRDERIYVVGGQPFTGGAVDILEAYDPVASTWSRRAPMPTPRMQLGVSSGRDGRIYACGGHTRKGHLPTVEAYAPTTGTWERRADMPTALSDAATVAGPDGRIFVIGGMSSGAILNSVLVYSPESDTWAFGSPMPVHRRGAAGALGRDGRIYVFGGRLGQAGAETLARVDAYDPSSDIWAEVAPMPTPRAWLAAAAMPDGRIVTLGGHNDSLPGHDIEKERGYLKVVEIYDVATGTWVRGPSLRTGRASHGAASQGERIYVVGGALDWLDVFEIVPV
jgi:N-acetylneuraminic acid mutarotase